MLYKLLLTRNKEKEDSVCASNSKVLDRNTLVLKINFSISEKNEQFKTYPYWHIQYTNV